jgi:putative ABC transport system permease protein
MGRFGLTPHQAFPLNAYVSLPQLQRAVEQEGKVNSLLIASAVADGRTGDGVDAVTGGGIDDAPGDGVDGVTGGGADDATSSEVGSAPDAGAGTEQDDGPTLVSLLQDAVTLEDIGLHTYWSGGHMVVESREFVLRPGLVTAIEETAAELGAPAIRVQTYLANSMRVGDRLLPYSTVSALGGLEASSQRLLLIDGSPAPPLANDEILLNEWAATELGAGVGDLVEMAYYIVGPHEELITGDSDFRVAGVVAMRGLAVDGSLTPEFPGIEGADDISQWDPPFPVDLDMVRPEDEAYWDEYAATPKAFVAEDTAQRLWSTRFGSTTSVRLEQRTRESTQSFESRFARLLLARVNLQELGFSLLTVREDGLSAASGATDFGGLFIGFSFFLIISSALLVGLLFSLGVEQRAREIGLRLALGFRLRRVRRQLLGEGMVLAAVGALLGILGGVAYGWLMMVGLRTLWLPAVGSPLLFLHVTPLSLILGWLISVLVVLASIWSTVRKLGRVPATSLLAGSFFTALARRPGLGKFTPAIAYGSSALALALFAYATISGTTTSPAISMSIGTLLLVAGLSFFAIWCRGMRGGLPRPGAAALMGMAARNSSWNPGRSILSVALVACACFVIVVVAANRRDPASEEQTIEVGGGGYALLATSDVPLYYDLNSAEARYELGFPEAAVSAEPATVDLPDDQDIALGQGFEGVEIMALRLLPGDDASCLNLYRPQRPGILGIPAEQIERGGFEFAATISDEPNPWELLEMELEPGVIPAFGDIASTQWILKVGLGQDLAMEDELGQPLRLRIVGTLSGSIFQSELLVSEENFLRHFPNQSGYSTFLVDVPEERVEATAQLLESNLSEFGFDTTSTAEKIAGFLAVQNTYLSTFQMLGGLGLLLGTVGLGIVLVRNIIERRGELATLRACGYRRSSLTAMVLAENAFLLVVGTLIGSLSALFAVAPRYLGGDLQVPLGSLFLTLALVLIVGMLASVASVMSALRVPLLPVLKEEH